jgi:DNA/RNA-binding domain of Phe-tRNA-synthetase-like protein
VLTIDEHPLLRARAFTTRFSRDLGELESPAFLQALLRETPPNASSLPVERDEKTRVAIRGLLRHGGYRPTGRGKPASEYLLRAAGEGVLAAINPAVDACNAVSLASGIPISVIDLDLAREPLRIGLAEKGESYVFNASGQSMDLAGLLCVFDALGPCANAVKDSQRTKTHDATLRTLSVLWGSVETAECTDSASTWYRELLQGCGAMTEQVL